jgi:hypothetical protein
VDGEDGDTTKETKVGLMAAPDTILEVTPGQMEAPATIQVVIAGPMVGQDIIQVEMLSTEVLDITQVEMSSMVEMKVIILVTPSSPCTGLLSFSPALVVTVGDVEACLNQWP